MTKKSFVLYNDSKLFVEMMSDEDAGILFKQLFRYQCQDDYEIEVPETVMIAFAVFKTQFDRDDEKYEATCKARSESGKLGGRPKKANGLSEKQKKQMVILESKQKQSKAKKADSDSDSVSDSVSVSKFKKPTLEEVQVYMKEKHFINSKIESEKFVDHYNSNGWKVGSNSMKCWKSTVRNWGKNDKFGVKIQKPLAEMTDAEKSKHIFG